MFDKHAKRVDFRRGLQFNSNLEHANNIMANLKMHMPVIPPHLNDILSGENGGFGFRIVRNKGKKYIPWKDNNNEQKNEFVFNSLNKDVTEYLSELTKPYYGKFEQWM